MHESCIFARGMAPYIILKWRCSPTKERDAAREVARHIRLRVRFILFTIPDVLAWLKWPMSPTTNWKLPLA